jgi:2-polyprenyl-3-methyl-5-hydroxy-6-metoxy-1,4-benzoquinol methylase
VSTVSISACLLCGSRDRRPFRSRAHIRLYECARCGLVYADPQHREVVERRYATEYDLAAHFAAFEARKRIRYERHLAWLPRPSPGASRLCDVGCGDGQFLEAARSVGWDGFGVELNPPAAARVRERGFEVHLGKLEAADSLPWGSFDIVTSWDSLEHVPDPTAFVAKVTRLMKPGGWLAITTLNRRSLVAMAFRSRWSMIVEDHYTYWDVGSLTRIAADRGLTPIQSTTFGLGRDFVSWADRLARVLPFKRPTDDQSVAPPRGWDSSRAVLAAEHAVNAPLRVSGRGVEIAMIFRERRSA